MPGSLSEFERLFLLEFFVDYINIQNTSLLNVDSSLCVSFQFLHYPVMRVCEEDFTPKTRPLAKDAKIIFKSGKSCLFSVHSDENKKIPSQFNLVIAVCQKTRCGDGRQLIGHATVNLRSSFINLLQPPTDLSVPSTGVRHDLFPLKDSNDKVIGGIAAFARISCFGKLIVTQFQLAAEDDVNYMFKGTDTENLFKGDDTLAVPNIDYEGDEKLEKDTPYCNIFGYPQESEDDHENEIVDESITENESEEGTDKPDGGASSCQDDLESPADVEKSQEEETYKEIGAEVNGHSIIIRVLKKRKREKKTEEQSMQPLQPCCCPPEPPICPNAPKLNVCSCDYPLPPELIPRCPPQCPPCCPPPPPCCPPPPPCSSPPCHSPMPVQPVNETLAIDNPRGSILKRKLARCPKEDCPLNLSNNNGSTFTDIEPGTVAMKGDQVFFQSKNNSGEPMSANEQKMMQSLYYKTNCKDPSRPIPNSAVQ